MRPASLSLIAVLLTGSCFLDFGRGLWTPDEPREAGISREMYAHPGVIPTLNGEPFVEKPPLYYWATAGAFRLAGGPGVGAARAVSLLAALCTLAVVFVWVSRAVSEETAAVAVVLLATTSAFVTSAHWVRIDALLMLFCTIAVWSAWERLARGAGPGFLALFHGGLIFALWTKGLIGPVLVGAGLATYAALSRSLRVLSPLRPILSSLVVVAAVGSLAAAIAATGGRAALSTWFWVNHVQRFVHPVTTGHEGPLLYYTWTLPLAVLPWLVPMLALLRFGGPFWDRARTDAALVRFAAAMTVGPLALLSLASSKREVYLLPLLPALSLLMAISVRDRMEAGVATPKPGALTRAGDWLQAALLALTGTAPPIASMLIAKRATAWSGLTLLLGATLAVALAGDVFRGRMRRAFWLGAGSIGWGLATASALLIPPLDAVKDLAPFVRSIDAVIPRERPVHAIGADETLLGIVSFVTGRHVTEIEGADLRDADYVLSQALGSEPDPPALRAAYDKIADGQFGPRRRMALWHRRP